jgi:hypothetical protein
MNYSICLLDKGGCTQRTQFGPYEDDAAALVQARKDVDSSPIVEVWRGEQLVARLFRDPQRGEATQ